MKLNELEKENAQGYLRTTHEKGNARIPGSR